MALLAENALDRVEQLIALSERLTALIETETALIAARKPLPGGAAAEEKARLANAYRFELARIKQDERLIAEAPQARLDALRRATETLHTAMAGHEIALGALRTITEGLVQAMAEALARVRTQARGYNPSGRTADGAAPTPVAVDRSA